MMKNCDCQNLQWCVVWPGRRPNILILGAVQGVLRANKGIRGHQGPPGPGPPEATRGYEGLRGVTRG
jgi:hypothetical protein